MTEEQKKENVEKIKDKLEELINLCKEGGVTMVAGVDFGGEAGISLAGKGVDILILSCKTIQKMCAELEL